MSYGSVGTIRNRTEIFMRYRNSARQRTTEDSSFENLHSSKLLAAAIDSSEGSIEAHPGHVRQMFTGLPPRWVDVSEGVAADIEKIKEQLGELSKAQAEALMPTFDESETKEQTVEILSQELSRLFKKCESKIKSISRAADDDSESEADRKVTKNITITFAQELQALSMDFRKKQKSYLQKLKSQKDGSTPRDEGASSTSSPRLDDPGFTDFQVQRLEEQDLMVAEREDEIRSIVESVNDLADVMKDLSVLVIEQGTILDRIDYNIEEVAQSMEKAVVELTKAEEHQKSSRALMCILLLLVLVVIMAVVVAIRKSTGGGGGGGGGNSPSGVSPSQPLPSPLIASPPS